MAGDTTQNTSATPAEEQERFDISFGNGALKKLKGLAVYLGVSEEKLGDVLVKGMKVIEVAKDYGDGKICLEDKDGKKIVISVKDL
ncbi:hypothetical protein EPN90_03985 [Patescibacteria group bacterium]|nr:MAG: hypothetical protein EPN90_03985 [Patescibacteria group bacterium]